MNEQPRVLSPFMLFVCMMMRIEPDLLAMAPLRDHLTVLFEFYLLTLVSAISGAAWAAFWSVFLPLWGAIPMGCVSFAFIFLLDQAIAACSAKLAGFLKNPAPDWSYITQMVAVARLSITMILSLATSWGAEMAMAHHAIVRAAAEIRQTKQQAVDDHYYRLEDKLRHDHFGVLIDEQSALNKTISENQPLLDRARREAAAAGYEAEAARIEQHRQATGEGPRQKGKKKLYGLAEDAETAANGRLAAANRNIEIYQPRLSAAQDRLKIVLPQLAGAEDIIKDDIAALEAERRASAVPAGLDPVIAATALSRVEADPVDGPAARSFGWGAMLVLVTIELAFFLVKTVFSATSVYTAIVISDTKRRVWLIDTEYQRAIEQIISLRKWPLEPDPVPSNDEAEKREEREAAD